LDKFAKLESKVLEGLDLYNMNKLEIKDKFDNLDYDRAQNQEGSQRLLLEIKSRRHNIDEAQKSVRNIRANISNAQESSNLENKQNELQRF